MKFKLSGTIDWFIYIIPFLLVAISLVLIYSLTYVYPDKGLFTGQAFFILIGFLLAAFLSFLDYRNLKGLSWIIYVLGILSLMAVIFWGKNMYGAKRWLDFGFFQLQPSEFFRLIIAIILAKLFSDQEENGVKLKTIILGCILTVIPIFLIMKQPDFGTAIIIFMGATSIFLTAKISKKYLLSLVGMITASAPLIWIFLKDYQRERIYSFLNPSLDPQGSSYNVIQSIIAVGSGELWGRGLGQGTQSRLHFLPVSHTDFIFAVLAESTGFIGAIILIILFLILITRIIRIASIARDDFGQYLAIGFASMLLFQVFIHIGMNMGIMPVTGIPLPFVSHGGSAIITNLIAIGILQSIHIRHKKIDFR